MKKLISLIALNLILVTPVNAGFWGFMADTKTLLGSGSTGGHYSTNVDAKKDNAKIQQALAKLGFYKGKFTGNLNTFESRTAIEDFQLHYQREDTGILSKIQEQDLLYMHDLLKIYKLELHNVGIGKKGDSKKITKVFRAFDKLENKLSKNKFSKKYISSSFKKEIKKEIKKGKIYLAELERKRQLDLAELERKRQHEPRNISIVASSVMEQQQKYNAQQTYAEQSPELLKKGLVSTKDGLMWMRCSLGQTWTGSTCKGDTKRYNWQQAIKVAKTKEFSGYSDWRLPTFQELDSLVYCSKGRGAVVIKSNGHLRKGGLCLKKGYQKPTLNQALFPNTASKFYWSSSPHADYSGYTWGVNFYRGNGDGYGQNSNLPVRLVRVGQ